MGHIGNLVGEEGLIGMTNTARCGQSAAAADGAQAQGGEANPWRR